MIFSRFKWNETSFLELTNPTSAYIYYRHTRLNLLSGYPETYSFDSLLSRLSKLQLQDRFDSPTVFHFYYEFGLIQMGLGHAVDDQKPLVIEIEYAHRSIKKTPRTRLKNIPLKTLERPSWSEYKIAFQKIQEHLLSGNCYQVNLTYPFDFETEEMIDPRDISDFFFSRPGLGEFAHLTFLRDEMILSNSPECLFHSHKNKILTMPIKGTAIRTDNWKKDWELLLQDEKEEGELNMITDLLRNDLNSLDKPQAKVIRKRSPLLVPGLIHQCSILAVELTQDVSILKAMNRLFPGGSITGAPKKRVMEIIQEVERYSRGIYCGSTMLCLGERKATSINIRTASLSVGDRLWRYGAGGGITLLSRPNHEFSEMESKVKSFLTLIKTPGY